MRGKKPWKVRVRRQIEDWIEIQAFTLAEAEKEAAGRPGVVSIFPGSTILADRPVDPNMMAPAIVVEEET